MIKNLFPSHSEISLSERAVKNNHAPKVVWFTGLSGSGKSTIAKALERKIFDSGKHVYMLDGDNIRMGLNSDLCFSDLSREENIRRIAHVASLFYDAGLIILVAAISPFKKDRDFARELIGNGFIEVYVKTHLDVCKARDPKGLYKKFELGEISNFTGISSPYEEPDQCEVYIDSDSMSIEDAVNCVYLKI